MFKKIILAIFLLLLTAPWADAARKLPPSTVEKKCEEVKVKAENIKTKKISEFTNACVIPEWWVILWKSWFNEDVKSEYKKDTLKNYTVKVSFEEKNPNVLDNREMTFNSKEFKTWFSNTTFENQDTKIVSSKDGTTSIRFVSDNSWDVFLTYAAKKSNSKMIDVFLKQWKTYWTVNIDLTKWSYVRETKNFWKLKIEIIE